MVWLHPNGSVVFTTAENVSGNHDQYSVTTGYNDGAWHHVVAAYDGTNKFIYVDGVLNVTPSNIHEGVALGRALFGSRFDFIGDGSEAAVYNGERNNFYYGGQANDIALFDNALTQTDVTALFIG